MASLNGYNQSFYGAHAVAFLMSDTRQQSAPPHKRSRWWLRVSLRTLLLARLDAALAATLGEGADA